MSNEKSTIVCERVTSLQEWRNTVKRAKNKIRRLRELQNDPRCSLDTYYRLQYEIEDIKMEVFS